MGVLLLEGEHIVCLGKQTAGSVQVLRKGLYYRILCRCHLPGDVVCRLVAKLGEREEYIGIPVPEGDVFLLEKMRDCMSRKLTVDRGIFFNTHVLCDSFISSLNFKSRSLPGLEIIHLLRPLYPCFSCSAYDLICLDHI